MNAVNRTLASATAVNVDSATYTGAKCHLAAAAEASVGLAPRFAAGDEAPGYGSAVSAATPRTLPAAAIAPSAPGACFR